MTFGNGMVIREPIVDIDDNTRRVAWSAVGGSLTHYNASVQVFEEPGKQTKVVWTADLLPNEAAPVIEKMMNEGMAVMKATLDRASEHP